MAQKVTSERLVDIQLFDVYEGANIGSDKKSYALSFHFRDNNKTLTDQEIDSEMNAIRSCFEKEFNAQLR
jgi:phenylalanyl-tRNA synthetase beta chain